MFKLPNDDVQAPATNGKGFTKADAFVNIYLPANTESGKKKLGAIALRLSDEEQKGLIEYLNVDDEDKKAKRIKAIVNQMLFDFVFVDNTKPKAGFVLPEID